MKNYDFAVNSGIPKNLFFTEGEQGYFQNTVNGFNKELDNGLRNRIDISVVDDILNEINKEQISKGRTLALYEMRPIIEKYILTSNQESENID